jgi:Kae1-associated kinase Bud32
MRLISQGAEAKIYRDKDKVVKHRLKKDYRIKEIDNQLRGFRTRREAKILGKLEEYGFVPKVLYNDRKEKLTLEYLDGPKIRDVLDELFVKNKKKCLSICKDMAKKIKLMHDKNIIHGDLTTSNMILLDNKVYFIDFGLSKVSMKVEDKAVDIHLLKQALESKHYKLWEACFKVIAKEYNNKEVLSRLEKVEARGRNKNKGS